MKAKSKAYSVEWIGYNELRIEIKDHTSTKLYKTKVNLDNEIEVAKALTILEKYGHDIEYLGRLIKEMKDNKNSWFFYPLGSK